MSATNDLPDVLDTPTPARVATGFTFTEGPLWHPDDYWYFVDLRVHKLHRITLGHAPETVRFTEGGNGTTFDLHRRLIVCEGDGRKVTRTGTDGTVAVLVERYKGGRLNRPNDVVCHSNGCLYFTDPDKRRPYHEREIPGREGDNNLWDGAAVYRLAPDGSLSVLAPCEYPNGLALSPDERTMYVANTRSSKYVHAIALDADGYAVGRSIFADVNAGDAPGSPDGLKVDSLGRVYCTGPGGIWVWNPDGTRIGMIRWPASTRRRRGVSGLPAGTPCMWGAASRMKALKRSSGRTRRWPRRGSSPPMAGRWSRTGATWSVGAGRMRAAASTAPGSSAAVRSATATRCAGRRRGTWKSGCCSCRAPRSPLWTLGR